MTLVLAPYDPGYLDEGNYLEDDYLDTIRAGYQGFQFTALQPAYVGFQFRAVLYNTINLRVLCNFKTRGNGSNWTASSTETGDFDVNNVNTDILEQIWRSATGIVTSINLDCDAGSGNNIFLDTFAILNHNLTTSATINLIGSDNASHSPTGVTIPITATSERAFYIASTVPLNGYRYWRLSLSDPTNPDNFLSIGTILGGESEIFQGECFTDELGFELTDYAEVVPTEGHTNVMNSLALRKAIRLDFKNLDFDQLPNMQKLRDIFETYRTTHKCLWIPTPSTTDYDLVKRYAVFAKIAKLPTEAHNYKTRVYTSLSLDLDEAR